MKINKTRYRFTPQSISRDAKSSGNTQVSSRALDNSVVKFDSRNVTLVEERSDGSVKLAAEVEVDILLAAKQGITSFDINLTQLAQDTSSIEASQQTPDNIVDELLVNHGKRTLMQRELSEKKVKTVKLDITKSIDNSIASRLPKMSLAEYKKTMSSKQKVLRTVPITKFKQTSLETPVLQTPTDNFKTQLTDRTEKQILHDSLFKDNKPVGSHSHKNLPYITSEEAVAGVKNKDKREDSRRRISTSRTKTSRDLRNEDLVNKLMNGPVKDVDTINDIFKRQSDGNNISTAVVLDTEESPLKTTTIEFELTRQEITKLGNNFNIEIQAEDIDGNIIQRAGCCIDLVEKITDGLVSSRKPETIVDGWVSNTDITKFTPTTSNNVVDEEDIVEVPGFEGGGGSSFGGVDLSIHVFNPYEPLDFAEREETGFTSPSPGEESQQSGNIVVVRTSTPTFSPPAAQFAERIRPSVTRHLASANSMIGKAVAEVDNRFVSISAFPRKTGMLVYLTGFQTKYSIAVFRRDLTIKEKNFKILNVNEPIRLVSESQTNLTFLDIDVKFDHTYEYKTKIYTREGREIFGSKTVIATYKNLSDNKALIKLSKPEVRLNRQGKIDARFTIDTVLDDTNISALSDALKNQGLSDVFLTDISNNRERLKQIIAYRIERVDLTMGITEHIGIVKGGKFSDIEASNSSNAAELQSNRDYRYVIELLIRDLDSLIPEAQRTQRDAATQKSYETQASKHLHPDTLRTGTYRSSKKIKDAIYTEEMSAGYIGVQTEVSITTRTARPKITGGNCILDVQGRAVITWKITGRAREIDHFVITSERLGMKAIVGRAQTPSYNGTYKFIDDAVMKTAGDINYYIQPVYSDLTYGSAVRLGKVEGSTKRKRL